MNDLNDIINKMSFIIGIANYEENLTQIDKKDIMHAFDLQTDKLIKEFDKRMKFIESALQNLIERVDKFEKF